MRLWLELFWNHLVRLESPNRVLRVPLMLVPSSSMGRVLIKLAPSILVPWSRFVKVGGLCCRCKA